MENPLTIYPIWVIVIDYALGMVMWTLIARVGYDNSRMGQANAMAYVSIVLSIAFTYYFFTKLVAARRYMGGAA